MLLAQIASALITFTIYNACFGWRLALLIIGGVGFHELCHLAAAKKQGLATAGFWTVPFVGGCAIILSPYRTRWQQVITVLAGPLGGGLFACLFAGVYYLTDNQLIGAAAGWMLFMNAANLTPLSFLDGGQLMDTITYSVSCTLGLACRTISTIVAVVLLFRLNPILSGLILTTGFLGLRAEYRDWCAFRNKRTYLCSDTYLYPPEALTKLQMLWTVIGYAGTLGLLVSMLLMVQHSLGVNSLLDFAGMLKR